MNAESRASRSESARRPSPRLLLIGLLAVVVVTVAASLGVSRLLGDQPVDGGTPPPGATSLNDEERAFYEYVAPRLRDLAAEARALADLGAARSRNLIALQSHNQRVDELMSEIDAHAEANGVPDRFADAFAGYRQGAQLTEQAVAEFQQAFVRFDWDRVGEAVETFQAGADALDGSVAALEAAGGLGGTPAVREPAAQGTATAQ